MTDLEIEYGDHKIDVELIRSKRKTLETRVLPNGSVQVRAPENLGIEKIREIVSKRGRWIVKKQEHFEQYPKEDLRKKYVSGETHRYLGRQYRLKVIQSEQISVKMKGKFIEVHTLDKSPVIVEELLYQWYMEHALRKFNEVLDSSMKTVAKYGIERPELKIKRMKKRWGSCITNKKTIHLNLELIRTPPYCIEYVIIHELLHFKVPNHQNKYYALMNQILPNWSESKKRLEILNLS